MFPADNILIARGKYSTLGKERHQQIERTQKLADTMRKHMLLALIGMQERPVIHQESIVAIRACIANWEMAWKRTEELCSEMAELKPLAWNNDDLSELRP